MRQETQVLFDRCQDILATYDFQITVRQLYYRLVAAMAIPNNLKSYKKLDTYLIKWRKNGLVDPNKFCDLTRKPITPGIWPNLESFFQTVSRAYKRDPWQSQEYRPEIWLEKLALAGVFEPVCREWSVTLQVCRGYTSISSLCDAVARGVSRILYFGDFDPSGIDIERSIETELIDTWNHGVSVSRVALTDEQVEEYDLPTAIPKESDSRTNKFTEKYGFVSVELDALPPDTLQNLLEESIKDEIGNAKLWKKEFKVNEVENKRLREFIEKIKE